MSGEHGDVDGSAIERMLFGQRMFNLLMKFTFVFEESYTFKIFSIKSDDA